MSGLPPEGEEWVRRVNERLEREDQARKGNGAVRLPTIEVAAGHRHLAADQGLQALVAARVAFYNIIRERPRDDVP